MGGSKKLTRWVVTAIYMLRNLQETNFSKARLNLFPAITELAA